MTPSEADSVEVGLPPYSGDPVLPTTLPEWSVPRREGCGPVDEGQLWAPHVDNIDLAPDQNRTMCSNG